MAPSLYVIALYISIPKINDKKSVEHRSFGSTTISYFSNFTLRSTVTFCFLYGVAVLSSGPVVSTFSAGNTARAGVAKVSKQDRPHQVGRKNVISPLYDL